MTDDIALLVDALDGMLDGAREAGPVEARRRLGQAGWIWPDDDGLAVPRAQHVVLVGLAIGRNAAPIPWSTLVATGVLLQRLPVPDAAHWTGLLADGLPTVAVAPPPDAQGRSLALGAADALPVLACGPGRVDWHDGGTLALRPVTSLDGHAAAWVDATWAQGRAVGTQDQQRAALQARTDWGGLASSAHIAGLLQALLAWTRDSVTTRRQFGAPVGSFQAVQHQLVDMHVATEELRALCMATAARMDAPDASAAVAALRVKCARSARLGMQTAVQLHGAMGLTQEVPVGRGVLAIEAELARFGGPGTALATLQQALLGPAPAHA